MDDPLEMSGRNVGAVKEKFILNHKLPLYARNNTQNNSLLQAFLYSTKKSLFITSYSLQSIYWRT